MCFPWCVDESNRACPLHPVDDKVKLKFHWSLVWHPATFSPPGWAATRTSQRTGQCNSAYNAPARPGATTYKAFNQGRCTKATTHADQQHICAYCLSTVKRAFPHPEQQCNRKKGAEYKKCLKGRSQDFTPSPSPLDSSLDNADNDMAGSMDLNLETPLPLENHWIECPHLR